MSFAPFLSNLLSKLWVFIEAAGGGEAGLAAPQLLLIPGTAIVAARGEAFSSNSFLFGTSLCVTILQEPQEIK